MTEGPIISRRFLELVHGNLCGGDSSCTPQVWRLQLSKIMNLELLCASLASLFTRRSLRWTVGGTKERGGRTALVR